MNHAQRAIARTRKFVSDHQVAITVVATTTVCVALNRYALKQHDDFLREHGLYDEFYAMTDED